MPGTRKRRILEDPVFREIAKLCDLDVARMDESFFSTHQSKVASYPRPRRKQRNQPKLWERGLRSALRSEGQTITPQELRDRIAADGGVLTYDKPGEDDVELRTIGESIIVKDLTTGKSWEITKTQLPMSLWRAKQHDRN